MIEYELINLMNDEVVDITNNDDFELPEANFYFQRKKRLSRLNFNKWYKVVIKNKQ